MSGRGHTGGHTDGRQATPQPFDLVVIVGSLGGSAAVREALAGLPSDFPAAVLVVQHRRPSADDPFVSGLANRTHLPVRAAVDGQLLTAPSITVLPAHQTASIVTTATTRALRLHPAPDFRVADPLITSVAECCAGRALCVVLTGRLDDGAAGVRALKDRGGRAIAQEPGTARAPGMPMAAVATGCVDLVLPLARIPHALIALTMAPGAAALLRVPPAPWATPAA